MSMRRSTARRATTDYEGQLNQAETILNSGTKQAIAIAPLDAGMAATVLGNADIPILAVDTNLTAHRPSSARRMRTQPIRAASTSPSRSARAARY